MRIILIDSFQNWILQIQASFSKLDPFDPRLMRSNVIMLPTPLIIVNPLIQRLNSFICISCKCKMLNFVDDSLMENVIWITACDCNVESQVLFVRRKDFWIYFAITNHRAWHFLSKIRCSVRVVLTHPTIECVHIWCRCMYDVLLYWRFCLSTNSIIIHLTCRWDLS